jgi:YD repeat-containing protein
MKKLSPAGFILLLAVVSCTFAQQPITFQYFYDDLNQLVKVVDSTGTVMQYVYDSVGNILQINRSVASNALTIFNVTPLTAPTGGTITIQGQGFSTTPSLSIVTIGGIMVTVLSATSTTLVVAVPANALSGPVVVTVGNSTVTASTNETIVPLPLITSINPKTALAGTTLSTFTVTGANLTGATFGFPLNSLVVSGVSILPNGTSATMTVTISMAAQGRFTLMATNAAGSSDPTPRLGFLPRTSSFNTLTVPGSSPGDDPDLDGLTNAQEITLGTDPLNGDTDGDSYPDGLEVAFGSDPLNSLSIPNVSPRGVLTQVTPLISVLNRVSPAPAQPTPQSLEGAIFSILNPTSPAPTQPATQVSLSPVLSLLNGTMPMTEITTQLEQDSAVFSILNGMASPMSTTLGGLSGVRLGPQGRAFVATALRRGAQPINGMPACLDSDRDGLCDEDELILGTDPFNFDSDGDGFPDGMELALGSDPLNPKSFPDIHAPGYLITPAFSIRNLATVARADKPAQGEIHVQHAQANPPSTDPDHSHGPHLRGTREPGPVVQQRLDRR